MAGLSALAPSASADKIVFTSASRDGGGLVVMRPGGRVVSVARGFSEAWYDVSLDGRRLVRGTTIPRGRRLVGGLAVNPFTAGDRLAVRRTRVVARANPGIGLRWSPNGRFVAGARTVGGSFQILVVRVGGGRARRLATSVPMLAPSWSPNSRRIAASGPRGLWVINVATGAAREILSLGEDEVGAPAWSPDGRWIAFVRTPPSTGLTGQPLGSSQLWLVRPDGSGLRQLTKLTGASATGAPAWSPDGRRLAFTYRGPSNWPVATIRANGTGLRTLYTRGLQNYGVDWSR
jgi:TolB protein